MNPGTCGLLALLFTAESCFGAKSQFVEIAAELQVASHRSDQTNGEASTKPRSVPVHCITDGHIWQIDSHWMQGGIDRWFYDGTNIFESLQITQPLPPEKEELIRSTSGLAVVPFERARSNLTINIWPSADGHPLANQIVNLTWLAYCSANYLARKDRLIPLPYDELRHTPDRYAYTDKTDVFPNFGLPRTVDLFLSKDRYLSSIEGFYKGWGTHYLPWMRGNVTNLHEGAAMFHYAVNATTNFVSLTFPLRFEFSQEGRSFIQNGDWFTRGAGTLKSIRKAAAPKGLFNPKMQQTVVDWRFHDDETGMDANTYPWTKDSVPRTDDPALREKFKKHVDSMRRHKEQAN